MSVIIEAANIVKQYYTGGSEGNRVLNGVTIDFQQGTFCAVLGPSGSGKSTLLKCLSGLEPIDGGNVLVLGENITEFSRRQTNAFRQDDIAFVFQEYNLISDLTIRENIMLDRPLHKDVLELSHKWGIHHVLDKFPSHCSGGQQQKAALLRALNKRSKILFCDEPTGALDTRSTGIVLAEIQELVNQFNTTVIMITHNEIVTKIADRIVRLHDGKIVSDNVNPNPLSAMEVEW